ncbi:MAG: hypothetical protein WB757_12755 [Candidatus Cybelea sp.]
MSASEEAPPTAESTSVQTPSLLASARDITFVLAIIAFFVGFEYRYYYYDHDLHVPSSVFPFVDNKILAGSYSVFIDQRLLERVSCEKLHSLAVLSLPSP